MKIFTFLLLLFCIPTFVISQVTENDEVFYIDSLGQYGTFENYKYIRVIKDLKNPNLDSYPIKEYYRSGKIAMSGAIKSAEIQTKIGSCTYFFESGTKESVEIYKDGFLQFRYDFYENGAKKMVTDYDYSIKDLAVLRKIKQFWDESGVQKVIDGNGFLELKDKDNSEIGEVKNSFKNGVWKGRQYDISYKETYDNGKLISGISTDKNLESYTYTELESKPIPKHGMQDFYNFIGQNFRVPETEGIIGRIIIAFTVDKNGAIVDPRILRDIGYETGEQAKRLLLKYGNWISGIQRGQKVSCTYVLPITIQSSN